MADIAILVAEEYERRVKSSRKSGQEVELVSCVGVLGQNLKGLSSSWVKEKVGLMEEKMVGVLGNRSLEPKSQMSLAARNGLFSA
ncbi:hypothetical protein CDL12_21742 [Handroanthus impetiginosus]|uniref:Uncharacterized protein n=1 Tax=Handroanthus impetiginosus TaxID=429701 RepID=A0A2G9GKB7_9LAMI|nr:hypothetical protein CDL12_21742 [Handroanthus impetiginosus]